MSNEEWLLRENARREVYQRGRRYLDSIDRQKTAIPPKVLDPPKKGYRRTTSCRRCGFGLPEAGWKYCPNCGQAIMAYTYAGVSGWNHDEAEKEFKRMVREAENEPIQ